MPFLTSLILAAFAAYIGAWYFGSIDGNFSLLLFVASVVTGLYWLGERFYFLPARRREAERAVQAVQQRREELTRQGIEQVDLSFEDAERQKHLAQPWWLDWTAGLFPVILVVFLLRSFVVEPFKIPSASMMPTLIEGDLILVNKFTYGLRLPVLNTKITQGTPLARGDVVVFRYPPKPSQDYIKRVVGLPGDEVAYLNKHLTINGQPVSKTPESEYLNRELSVFAQQFSEKLGDKEHKLLNNDAVPAYVDAGQVIAFPDRENCRYSAQGVVCKVPQGHYFMMGDNRDNSLDSRYWGFVPDQNVVGKAFFIWMNFGNIGRVGSFH